MRPISQKNFTKNLLKLMTQQQKENECCESPITECPPISSEEGNQIVCNDDGLFVPESEGGLTVVSIENSESITLTGNGNTGDPIIANINISGEPGNAVSLEADGLYVGNVDPSVDPKSKYLLSEVNDVFTFNGYKNKQITSQAFVEYFTLNEHVFSSTIEPYTTNGALTTATFGLSTSTYNDRITVTNGDHNSFLYFNNYPRLDVNVRYKLKLKVITKGTASSYVGIILRSVSGLGDSGTASKGVMVNLNTELLYRSRAQATTLSAPTALTTEFNGSGTFCSDGDVLEFTWEMRGTYGFETIEVLNLTTKHSLVAKNQAPVFSQLSNLQFAHASQYPGIILSGGTSGVYDFISFEADSLVQQQPVTYLMGDSMLSGFSVSYLAALPRIIDEAIPHNVAVGTGPGVYTNSFGESAANEIIKYKPKTVLIFSWLPLYWGEFQVGNPNYAAWYLNWTKLLNACESVGAIPVLTKYPVWPAGNQSATSQPNWSAFIDSEVVLHPTSLVMDFRSHVFNYNGGVGYHLGAADNVFVKDQFIALLEANNIL